MRTSSGQTNETRYNTNTNAETLLLCASNVNQQTSVFHDGLRSNLEAATAAPKIHVETMIPWQRFLESSYLSCFDTDTILEKATQAWLYIEAKPNIDRHTMFILGRYCVKCCTLDITLEQNTAPIGKTVSPLRKSTASVRESDILKRTVRSSRSSAYFTRTAISR